MTSKEALISLNERFGTGKYGWGFNIEKELKIINQDLDRLEKLEEENKALKSDNTALEIWNDAYSADWNKFKERNEKLEKFASIVKEFITIEKLNGYDDDFITQVYSSSKRISKEKADLVKEVLQDVKD